MTEVMQAVLPAGRLQDVLLTACAEQVLAPQPEVAPLFEMDPAMPRESRERLVALRAIYECAKQLIQLETQGAAQAVIEDMRAELNRCYDEVLWRFGPLHSPRTLKLLRNHPALPFLLSLEKRCDTRLGNTEKADLFFTRTVRAHAAPMLLSTSDPTQLDVRGGTRGAREGARRAPRARSAVTPSGPRGKTRCEPSS